MPFFTLTPTTKQQFLDDGFFVVKRLFDKDEIKGIDQMVAADQIITNELVGKRDADGNETKLAVRNELSNSPYSLIVCSERIAGTMQQLLDDEVYHYHHKMMVKEPRVGGAWEWHQDYGYWYNNGCLYPDMASCLIAIAPTGAFRSSLAPTKWGGLTTSMSAVKSNPTPPASRLPSNVQIAVIANSSPATRSSFTPICSIAPTPTAAPTRGFPSSVVTTRNTTIRSLPTEGIQTIRRLKSARMKRST